MKLSPAVKDPSARVETARQPSRRPRRLPARLSCERLEDRCTPSAVHFDAGGDGYSWNDALNWSIDALPDATADVIIGAQYAVIHDSGQTAINSLTCEGDLDFTGTLALAAASEVQGTLLVNGTVDLQGTASLDLYGGGAFAGTVVTATGTSLNFYDGDYTLADGLALDGTGLAQVGGAVGAALLQVQPGEVVVRATLAIRDGQSIAGAGTLRVAEPGRLVWSGGSMTGNGVTRIDAGGVMTVLHPNDITQTDRRLENAGTVVWQGSAQNGVWSLQGAAEIRNTGIFIADNLGNNRGNLSGPGAFLNIGVYDQARGLTFVRTPFTNRGVINVRSAGQLDFGLGMPSPVVNTGYFYTEAGGQCIFSGEGVLLDPTQLGTDPYMLRGPGWYSLGGPATLTVPQNATVLADQLETFPGSTITGLGTLELKWLYWGGGRMETAAGGAMGVTRIPVNGYMTIDAQGVGSALLLNHRELRNLGTVEWVRADQHITVSNGGTIINDGGLFQVFDDGHNIVDGVNPEIPGSQGGDFVVTNNGALVRWVTAQLGTVQVQIPFRNNGGTLLAFGNTTFTKGFFQSGNALSTFEGGVYDLSAGADFSGGTTRLNNSSILGRTTGFGTVFQNTRLEGRGTWTGPVNLTGGAIDLTGALEVQGRIDLNGTTVHLHGHQLHAIAANATVTGGEVFLENGTFRAGLPMFISGTVRYPGTLRAPRVVWQPGSQQIRPMPQGLNEVSVIDGDMEMQAGALLTFEIGGTQAGVGYGQLVVTGHAILGGTLQATLVNGFVPAAEPEPDTFIPLVFESYEGAFENDLIDLGQEELFFEIDYFTGHVALVTGQ